jgi:phage FluMu protein Com
MTNNSYWYREKDYRCRNCGRLMVRAVLSRRSYISIVCPKCGCLHKYAGGDLPNEPTEFVPRHLRLIEPEPEPVIIIPVENKKKQYVSA